MNRVPLTHPLTPTQQLVAELVADRKTAPEIAERLGIQVSTARFHVRMIAEKIPGHLPARVRVLAWWRGASLHVLSGGER